MHLQVKIQRLIGPDSELYWSVLAPYLVGSSYTEKLRLYISDYVRASVRCFRVVLARCSRCFNSIQYIGRLNTALHRVV